MRPSARAVSQFWEILEPLRRRFGDQMNVSGQFLADRSGLDLLTVQR